MSIRLTLQSCSREESSVAGFRAEAEYFSGAFWPTKIERGQVVSVILTTYGERFKSVGQMF
jgi:hypothetical protein